MRQAVFLLLMVGAATGAFIEPLTINERPFFRTLAILTLAMMLLLFVQLLMLQGSVYFGFPATAYAQNADTIPDALSLRYSKIRPAGTLGEPSYLGFVMTSLILLALPTIRQPFGRPLILLMATVCGLMSQSLSFVLSVAIIALFTVNRVASGRLQLVLTIFAIIGGTFLIVTGGEIGVLSRLSSGTILTNTAVKTDFSTYVRMIGPAEQLPNFLTYHPFGMPFEQLQPYFQSFTQGLGFSSSQYLMNGFYNLFFEFGFIGFFILILLMLVRDNIIRSYIFTAMFFNGGFLSVDKAAIIGFTVMLYAAIRRQNDVDDPSDAGVTDGTMQEERRI